MPDEYGLATNKRYNHYGLEGRYREVISEEKIHLRYLASKLANKKAKKEDFVRIIKCRLSYIYLSMKILRI
jgi:hypothetical protein